MRKGIFSTILVGFVLFTLILGFFFLAETSVSVYLSPDETAISAAARAFARTGSFVLSDPLVKDHPWLHPRSFVSTGRSIVPVGFLGMPFILSGIWTLFGDVGMALFTPLLVILCIIPLWSLSRSWGRLAQIATVLAWLTFPTVILYANRGLFANLPVVCLALWAAWIFHRWKHPGASAAAGILAGAALLIRPTEAVWVLPWVLAAYLLSDRKPSPLAIHIRHAVAFAIPVIVIACVGAFLAWKTYGSPLTIGYQLRDPSIQSTSTAIAAGASRVSWFESWAFGFHPRNVWYNVRSYLIGFLLPWFALLVGSAALAWREKKARPWILLAAWTVGILCLIYGQGLYRDHVDPDAVTVGNSFLRYLLPVSVIAALCLGWFSGWLTRRIPRYGTLVAVIVMSIVAFLGLWSANTRDDEGITQDRLELAKYAVVRGQAVELLAPDTVVFSDRSDKVFFPTFKSVSPMPPPSVIRAFMSENKATVVVFMRDIDDDTWKKWDGAGIALETLIDAGNETLYFATPN